jgi:antitoxin component YwqK of YwqJK toxin-antitoxin module
MKASGPDGTKIGAWQRDLKTNRATWTHYWPNGQKKSKSAWNIGPEARDLKRNFFGYVADGPAQQWDDRGKLLAAHRFVNGTFVGTNQ